MGVNGGYRGVTRAMVSVPFARFASAGVMGVCVMAFLAGAAQARQNTAPASPAPVTKPASEPASNPVPPSDVLRGPKVEDRSLEHATLVKRDFSGALVRLETRPEIAAVDLLGLTKEEREPADAVLADRAAKISAFTLGHYDLLIKLQGARQGGSRQELAGLMRDVRTEAGELFSVSLADQVAAALPEARKEKFREMVGEYVKALAVELENEDRAATSGSRGRSPGSPAKPADAPGSNQSGEGAEPMRDAGRSAKAEPSAMSIRRVQGQLFVREMARSFGSFVEDRREHADAMLKAVEATPEQENKIRGMLREFGVETAFKPTPQQRAELWGRILRELTPEQRRKAAALRAEK